MIVYVLNYCCYCYCDLFLCSRDLSARNSRRGPQNLLFLCLSCYVSFSLNCKFCFVCFSCCCFFLGGVLRTTRHSTTHFPKLLDSHYSLLNSTRDTQLLASPNYATHSLSHYSLLLQHGILDYIYIYIYIHSFPKLLVSEGRGRGGCVRTTVGDCTL